MLRCSSPSSAHNWVSLHFLDGLDHPDIYYLTRTALLFSQSTPLQPHMNSQFFHMPKPTPQ